MPPIEMKKTIYASAEAVFNLIRDYKKRLEGDTLLQEVYLELEPSKAERGGISVFRGKSILGGPTLRTHYISFEKGRVAAVNMLNHPPFFDTFAASIRHFDIG